jgi:hypothetical protein
MPLEIVPAAELGHEISVRSPIVGWRVNEERYTAVPLLADGSEGPTIDLRPLLARLKVACPADR